MSKPIAVKSLNRAGGIHLGGHQQWFIVSGQPVVCLGDRVKTHKRQYNATHGYWYWAHDNPRMVQASSWLILSGKGAVHSGHRASCNHPSDGQAWFTIS